MSDSDDKVITSTRELRRRIRSVHCDVKDDQKCHIVGLNLMKQLLNYYAKSTLKITEEELKRMVMDINRKSNIRCCSPEANTHDKKVEREVLDLLIEGTLDYVSLSPEALNMLNALKELLEAMIKRMQPKRAPLFTCLLEHIEKREFPLPLFCFNCFLPASMCEVGGTRIFCNGECQAMGALFQCISL